MSRLRSALRTAAQTAAHHSADPGALEILRLGENQTAILDATIHPERSSWRRDPNSHSGDRHRVYQRTATLAPGVDPVPIGSYATTTADGRNYSVESVQNTASGRQLLTLVRAAMEAGARPNAWE